MCGIFGVLSKRNIDNINKYSQCLDEIAHRGPDSSGDWVSGNNIYIGHRRLAILDLSPSGSQPMFSEDGDIVIVFNGEIYNYQALKKELRALGHSFSNNTDTQVIINAYKEWGVFCTKRFNGMFSFCLYDKKKNVVFLSRDRAGEKPLFYSLHKEVFRFASELKAILKDPDFDNTVSRTGVDCYLRMGYVPGDLSIFKHVKKLRAGHSLLFDLNTYSDPIIWKYWELPEFDHSNLSSKELMHQMEFLLEDAVKLQLHADVPVGILLSGGIDSSLVTAMASRISKNVKTFTISFPGHKKFDESLYAEIVAKHFGTEHIKLSGSEVSINDFITMSSQFDEPMADSSSIPTYLVSKLIRQYCTVALGGDGGDELFGGYPYYSRLHDLRNKIAAIPDSLKYLAASAAGSILPVGFKGRNWLKEINSNLENGLPMVSSLFDSDERKKLYKKGLDWYFVAENIQLNNMPLAYDLVERATKNDFYNYMCNDILVKVDRASMLNSLEVRAPFLDHRIIDFAFRKVPSHLKATKENKKILLKMICKKVLPAELDFERKQGFSIPLATWLSSKGEWNTYFKEILFDSDNFFFNKRYIEKLFAGQQKGRSNSERIYSLVVFELWRKNYNIQNI